MTNDPLILCLDYGQAKVGLAIGSLRPATPLDVIRYHSQAELKAALVRVVNIEKPDLLLFGWPADDLSQSTPATDRIRQLAEELHGQTGLLAAYHPETLTTKKALTAMLKQGVSQKRRRQMEDSYAAAAILDDYLNEHSLSSKF